jgi:hypothetical protein
MSASPYYGVYPLFAGKGSETRPSISFVNDYGTGLYRPSDGVTAIVSNGSEVIRFGTSVEISTNIDILTPNSLRFYDSDSTNFVGLKAPSSLAADISFTLPLADGSSGNALVTNGSGVLSWSKSLASLTPEDGAIVIGDGSEFVAESGSTARESLGLSIGSDVQEYDPDTAKTDVVQNFTAAQRGDVATLTPGATVTPNFAVANNFTLSLDQDTVLGNPTNIVAGQSGCITVVQDSTARTLSYGPYWYFEGGVPTLSITASSVSTLVYYVDSSTHITARLINEPTNTP